MGDFNSVDAQKQQTNSQIEQQMMFFLAFFM